MGSFILHGFFHIILGFPFFPWRYSMAKVGNKDKRPAAISVLGALALWKLLF